MNSWLNEDTIFHLDIKGFSIKPKSSPGNYDLYIILQGQVIVFTTLQKSSRGHFKENNRFSLKKDRLLIAL